MAGIFENLYADVLRFEGRNYELSIVFFRPQYKQGIRSQMKHLSIPGLLAIALVTLSASATQVVIGPVNPGAEDGEDSWYYGASGAASVSIDSSDPADGANDFTLENSVVGRTNGSNWRSFIFPLGPAAKGASPITFSFAYEFPGQVKNGDNMHIQLRFYNAATNFIGQKDIWIGDRSQDSAMTSYRTNIVTDIHVPRRAEFSDVTLTANFYPNDSWSSGVGRFDDISVMVLPRFSLFKIVFWTAIVLLGATCLTVLSITLARRR